MTRYSRIIRQRRRKPVLFLPEAVQVFIARRFVDGAAFFIAACAILYLLCLATYSHADPSLNTAGMAGADSVRNWLGLPGSYLADIMWQTLGLAGTVPGFLLLVWGVRVFKRCEIAPLLPRVAAGLAAMLFAAGALGIVPSGSFLLHPWMSGSGGTLVLDRMATLVRFVSADNGHIIAAGLCGVIATVLFIYAAAITRDEFRAAFSALKHVLFSACGFTASSISGFIGWVKAYGGDTYESPQARKPLLPARDKKEKRIAPPVTSSDDEEPEETDEHESDEGESEDEGGFIPVVARKPRSKKQKPRQTALALAGQTEDWELPPADLLQEAPDGTNEDQLDEAGLRKNAEMLQNVLRDYNVSGEIVSIHPGPVVTLYELEPAPGTKSSRVIGLSDDIARSMAAVSVRCANIPGRNVIGIELPNRRRQTVYMRELLEGSEEQRASIRLPLILGKDIGGRPVIADLAKMPHLLIAGTTGSGKSVAVNTMILSLLYTLSPEQCRFIMIDPKMLELSVYDDIPHLLSPVVTEPGKAIISLKWAVQEMENRYRAMSRLGVRNIEGYNERLRIARKKGETLMRKVQTGFDPESGKPVFEDQPMDMTELPYIVVVVDEFADLMLVAGKDVENAVQRLAQMARAAGIHLIMATQRPSVDVITGVIKANFPTRISFQVTSKIDSRTILGEGGAEQLLGMGDMLYMASGGRVTRVHGPFVSDDEVESVVNTLKAQASPSYIDDITEGGDFGGSEVMNAMFGEGEGGGGGDTDEFYDKAVALVARERKASTSFIQRYFQIGYNRAARIIEEMERQGVVSKASPTGKREILVGDYTDA